MDCSLPGSSLHGISQARILEWIPISFSRGSSQARIKPTFPAWQADSLLQTHLGNPHLLKQSLNRFSALKFSVVENQVIRFLIVGAAGSMLSYIYKTETQSLNFALLGTRTELWLQWPSIVSCLLVCFWACSQSHQRHSLVFIYLVETIACCALPLGILWTPSHLVCFHWPPQR